MAKFGIQRTQRLPVGTSTAVRATFDPGTGGGAVGQALTGAVSTGLSIRKSMAREEEQELKEKERIRKALEIKNRKNLDAIEGGKADNFRKDYDRNVQNIRDTSPPEEWTASIEAETNLLNSNLETLNFSEQERQLQALSSQNTVENQADISFAQATRRTSATAVASAEQSLVDLFATGTQDEIAINIRKHADTLRSNGKSSGEISAIINKASEDGKAIREKGLEILAKAQKSEVLDIALSQRNVDGTIDTKLADEKVDASPLDAQDKADLKNQIVNREIQETNRSNAAFADRVGEEDARLAGLLNEGLLTEQEVDNVNLAAIGDQKSKEVAWKTKWKSDLRKIASLSEPASSNESVYDALVTGSEAVERGSKSPAEWESEYRTAWSSGQLEKTDRRSLRSGDIVATKTMQNRAFTSQTDGGSEARFRLIESTEDQIGQFITARDLKIKAKDFTGAESLTKAIQKNQIQRWNMGVMRRTLREQISQNPEWSQAQIFTAADILTNEFDKDFSVLVKEFDTANPQKAITKNAPDAKLNDIWKDLSFDDKAKVWELSMLGATAEQIIGELP